MNHAPVDTNFETKATRRSSETDSILEKKEVFFHFSYALAVCDKIKQLLFVGQKIFNAYSFFY